MAKNRPSAATRNRRSEAHDCNPKSNIVLDVSGVNKSFGGLRALTNVNLQVEEGKVHAIIGPNGAGKSTLLNVCIGRIRPDNGHVVFNGETLDSHQPHEINQLGVPASSRRRKSSPS